MCEWSTTKHEPEIPCYRLRDWVVDCRLGPASDPAAGAYRYLCRLDGVQDMPPRDVRALDQNAYGKRSNRP
jgi:hypothetical protein